MEGKTISLKLVGYRIEGTTKLKDWYGQIGYIEMKKVDITSIDNTEDVWMSFVNDNGFGCQEILGAHLLIYELYEDNYTKFHSIKRVGEWTEEDEDKVFGNLLEDDEVL
jgi:hypothetical protein